MNYVNFCPECGERLNVVDESPLEDEHFECSVCDKTFDANHPDISTRLEQ